MDSKKLPAPKTDSTVPAPDLKREEGFATKYASHVAVESSAWDLKVIFGCVDSSAGPNTVLQHTAMALPWPSVKCLAYLLRTQLAIYEAMNGHVPFPVGGLTPPPSSMPEEYKKYPKAELVHGEVTKIWDEFVKENPEAFQLEEHDK
jgi:hypothetical protein